MTPQPNPGTETAREMLVERLKSVPPMPHDEWAPIFEAAGLTPGNAYAKLFSALTLLSSPLLGEGLPQEVGASCGPGSREPDPQAVPAASGFDPSRRADVLCAGYADAVSGLRYIEQHYGRLEGVGWDRVYDHFEEAVVIPAREGLPPGYSARDGSPSGARPGTGLDGEAATARPEGERPDPLIESGFDKAVNALKEYVESFVEPGDPAAEAILAAADALVEQKETILAPEEDGQ